MEQVRDEARTAFVDRLQAAGSEAVTRTATTTVDVESGKTAERYEYESTTRFPEIPVDTGGLTPDLPGRAMTVAGHPAVWHIGTHVPRAVGGHTAENYAETTTETADRDPATLTVDLGLQPTTQRESIRSDTVAVA